MASFVPNTAFPERHSESTKKRQFSLALLILASRSLVENDRPPSFQGASEAWDCASRVQHFRVFSGFEFFLLPNTPLRGSPRPPTD